MMETSTEKKKSLLKCNAVFQAAVIVLCLLVMMLFPDFRFHPIVVLCYALCVLFDNLSRMDHG